MKFFFSLFTFLSLSLFAGKTDLILFSCNRPLQLYACLESIQKYISDIDKISVVYRTTAVKYDQTYKTIQKSFPLAKFYKEKSGFEFYNITLNLIKNSNDYILFCVDDIICKDNIHLPTCISLLEKTNSYAFFLRNGTHINFSYIRNMPLKIPPLTEVEKDVFTWNFKHGKSYWETANNVDMTLYRKSTVLSLCTAYFYNPSSLESSWQKHIPKNKKGICFKDSKILNIPLNVIKKTNSNNHMNVSSHYLFEMFQKEKKIDISRYHQLKNTSAHAPLPIEFIDR